MPGHTLPRWREAETALAGRFWRTDVAGVHAAYLGPFGWVPTSAWMRYRLALLRCKVIRRFLGAIYACKKTATGAKSGAAIWGKIIVEVRYSYSPEVTACQGSRNSPAPRSIEAMI